MLRASKQWDVRCPTALVRLFPVRRGYYYKIDRKTAQRVCNALAKAYQVQPPQVSHVTPKGCNGMCHYYAARHSVIDVHARGHMKTTFHEFYHHLEHATRGKYDSSDRRQYAWEFADRLFEVLRRTK